MVDNSEISLIDRYLNNELSVDELNDFNKKLESDKEFRDFFEMMKPLGLVAERSTLRKDLKEFENELVQADLKIGSKKGNVSGGNRNGSFGLNKFLWILGGAITITGLIILISYLLKEDLQNQTVIPTHDSSTQVIDSTVNQDAVVNLSLPTDSSSVNAINDYKLVDNFNCEEGSSEVIIETGKAGLLICLPSNAVLFKTDSGYFYSEKKIIFQGLHEDQYNSEINASGSGISLSKNSDYTFTGLINPSDIPNYSFQIALSKDRKSIGVFTFYYKANLKYPSEETNSIKNFGKVSFWTDSGEDGIVKIYIDDKLVGQLDSYFESGQPLFGQKGTFTYTLPVGEHSIVAKSGNREASGKIQVEPGDSIIYKLFK